MFSLLLLDMIPTVRLSEPSMIANSSSWQPPCSCLDHSLFVPTIEAMAPSIWTIPERAFLNAYRTRYESADVDGRIVLLESKIIPRFVASFYSVQPSISDEAEHDEEAQEEEEEDESLIKQVRVLPSWKIGPCLQRLFLI